MTWRRAFAYWAGFLVLGAYWAVVLGEPSRAAPAHLTRAPFLSLAEKDVDGMELRRGTNVVRCRRVDGRWQVVEPKGGAVPSDLVTALVANLTQLPEVEVVDEGGGDVTQFGLQPPVSQITLNVSGKPVSLRLGSRNPSGTAVYAQRADSKRVFLIGLNVRYYEDLVFAAEAPAP